MLISIPIIVWGSQLILRLIDRFPLIILFGGGLLGWIAGGMLLTDSALKPWLAPYAQWDSYLHYGAAAFGALFVILLGSLPGAPPVEAAACRAGGRRRKRRPLRATGRPGRPVLSPAQILVLAGIRLGNRYS